VSRPAAAQLASGALGLFSACPLSAASTSSRIRSRTSLGRIWSQNLNAKCIQ